MLKTPYKLDEGDFVIADGKTSGDEVTFDVTFSRYVGWSFRRRICDQRCQKHLNKLFQGDLAVADGKILGDKINIKCNVPRHSRLSFPSQIHDQR